MAMVIELKRLFEFLEKIKKKEECEKVVKENKKKIRDKNTSRRFCCCLVE